MKKRLIPILLLVALGGAAQTVPPAPPSALWIKVPAANPYACDADMSPSLVTHDFPSSIDVAMSAFVSLRIDATGKVLDVVLARDPIASLGAAETESFLKWEFLPPQKAKVPVAGWATVRADLAVSYSRPQLSRIAISKIAPDEPLPTPLTGAWDETWLDNAPPLTDAKGSAAVESLDAPPTPKKTKWTARSFKGLETVKLWVEVPAEGKIGRIVPAELRDAALLPYLRRALARWAVVPARKGGEAVSCWAILEMTGIYSYDVSLKSYASVKKSAGLTSK